MNPIFQLFTASQRACSTLSPYMQLHMVPRHGSKTPEKLHKQYTDSVWLYLLCCTVYRIFIVNVLAVPNITNRSYTSSTRDNLAKSQLERAAS